MPKVTVHQSKREPSVGSTYSHSSGGYSSSGSSSASYGATPGVYRNYDSRTSTLATSNIPPTQNLLTNPPVNYQTRVSESGKNIILDYGQRDHVSGAPHPSYGGYHQ